MHFETVTVVISCDQSVYKSNGLDSNKASRTSYSAEVIKYVIISEV